MASLKQTPSQTVGPYYAMRLFAPDQNRLVPVSAPGRIRVEGCVLDADGVPMEDALVEIWQANAHGRFRHPDDPRVDVPLTPGFVGFGRAPVDLETRRFWFETTKPGRVPAPDGSSQAPHLSLVVQGRGMLRPSFTRLYFADETTANAADFVLVRVPEARRHTLLAHLVSSDGAPTYRFDIRFQGNDETVFFVFD
jgi:protocatechuate 3,4-dioxygenase alpha subunit